MDNSILRLIAFIFVVVGAVNWGLVGLMGFNLVAILFGNGALSRIIYGLVAVSGVYLVIQAFVHEGVLKIR